MAPPLPTRSRSERALQEPTAIGVTRRSTAFLRVAAARARVAPSKMFSRPLVAIPAPDHAPFTNVRPKKSGVLTAPQRVQAAARRFPLVDHRHPEAGTSGQTLKETKSCAPSSSPASLFLPLSPRPRSHLPARRFRSPAVVAT